MGVNFTIPSYPKPNWDQYADAYYDGPYPEPSDRDLARFERYGTRYRLNRARTSYGELTHQSMFMNYGYSTFSGYTYSGAVSGTDQVNQTRFAMDPTTITFKNKQIDQFTILPDQCQVLTKLVVNNSTKTKTLTTEQDTTTNSLSVTTTSRMYTLSVHDGSYSKFLNVKDTTTTDYLSSLTHTYSKALDVFNHTNTRSLSVKDVTHTNYLSALSGTYSNFLNVLNHTNTRTLSSLVHTYSKALDVYNRTNTRSLSVKDYAWTNYLFALSGTYSNYLNVEAHTNTRTLNVSAQLKTDTIETNNQATVESTTIGGRNVLEVVDPLSSGCITVNQKKYYSAEVLDHLIAWAKSLSGFHQVYNNSSGSGGSTYVSLSYTPSTAYIQQSADQIRGKNSTAWTYGWDPLNIPTPVPEPTPVPTSTLVPTPTPTKTPAPPPTPTPTPRPTLRPLTCTRWKSGLTGVTNIVQIDGTTATGTVSGNRNASPYYAYGNNVEGYMDASHFGIAAVHSGIVQHGELKTIKFVNVGVKNYSASSTANGVTSQTGGRSCYIRLSAI
ncbi:MAG: hypothetical protein RL709_316 [Pseudomonadota bacterium]